jgi:outer membrane protein assembly factor BamB
VDARGGSVRATPKGLAALGIPRHRYEVLVSAPGYAARSVKLDFRRRLSHRVEIWRPSLQWPLYGANPARTQAQGGIQVRPPFRIAWRREIGGLMEISMQNGRVLWKQEVGSLMASSPAIDPERGVLVSTSMQPGYVTVRSLETGKLRWRYYTGLAEPSPVIRDGVAYFGATNGNVYALDLDKRKPRWIFHGGVKITSSPALVGNRLYFGDYAGRVFALDSRNGRVIWRGSAGGRVYGTVAVTGGRVFAPSVFSGLSALSARNGRLLWRISAGSYVYSSPAAYKGRVYFGAYNGLVYAVSAGSGRIVWTRGAGGRVSGAVQVVDGLVYAASLEGRTTAWNWKTGNTVWTFPHGKYVPVSGSGERLLLHGATELFAVEHKRQR